MKRSQTLSYASFIRQCQCLAARYPLHLRFVAGRDHVSSLDLSSHLHSIRLYDGEGYGGSVEYSVCYNDQYQAPQLFLVYYDKCGSPLDGAAVGARVGAPLVVRDHPFIGVQQFALADCQSGNLLESVRVSDAHADADVAAWLSLTLSAIGLHLPLPLRSDVPR